MASSVSTSSPIFSVTKWHDTDSDVFMYDLYVNGRFDTRFYSYLKLIQRIQELIIDGGIKNV